MRGINMTRSEKNELLVKFACVGAQTLGAAHQYAEVEFLAKDAFALADAMLAEYLKRQPARPVAPAIPQPTPEERAEVARIIEQCKAEMRGLDVPEPRVCPEIARDVGT